MSERGTARARAAMPEPDAREAGHRRRRLRRRLLLGTAPFAIVAGLVGAKLVHQHLAAERAVAQYLEGDAEAALNTASQLQWLNWVERWKPDYDVGTSLLALDALVEAQRSLEAALRLAEPAEQCPVRANLAIAIERQGDRARAEEDFATAIAKWQEALHVLDGRDAACAETTSARSLQESRERIAEKLEEFERGGSGEGEQDGGAESPELDPNRPDPNQPDPGAIGDIEDSLDGNRQERDDRLRDGEQRGGGSVDRPW